MFPDAEPESQTPDDPCGGRGKQCGCRSNAPPDPYPNSVVQVVGRDTTAIEVQGVPEQTDYGMVTTVKCFALPLKGGGTLSLKWNHFMSQGAPGTLDLMFGTEDGGAYVDRWAPAGAGSVFSFLPILNNNDVTSGYRRRYSERGVTVYNNLDVPWAAVPYSARRDTTYFTEYDQREGIYYEYWNLLPSSVFGRLNRRYDTVGNQLNYNYSPNGTGNPLLRSITGDFAGSFVPYFEYADDTIDGSTKFAPITKIFVMDKNDPGNCRSIYFDYWNYLWFTSNSKTAQVLWRTTYPNGCVRQIDANFYNDVFGFWDPYREVDAEGYETYFMYGPQASGNIRKIVEPEGRITYYDPDGTISTNLNTRIPLGRKPTINEYLANTKFFPIIKRADALLNTTYFEYGDIFDSNNPWKVLGIVDPLKSRTYFEYVGGTGENKYAVTRKVSEFNGASTYYGYGIGQYDVQLEVGPRDATGFSVATYYKYDAFRNRIATIDALSNKTLFGRDVSGEITRIVDARNGLTYFNYGSATELVDSQVTADGAITYFGYSSFGKMTRFVSPRWQEPSAGFARFTTYYEFDLLDRRVKTIDPEGSVTYFDWTARGDLLDSVTPLGTRSFYTYDGLRRNTQSVTTDTAGSQLTQQKLGYDIYNNRTRLQNSLGNNTYYFFDSVDRVTARKDAILASTYYFYDRGSNLTALRNARGNFTYYFYDLLSRPVARRDALINFTYYSYDLANNRTHVRNARLSTTYYFYDALDRPQARRDALGNPTYYFYDPVGNNTEVRNARGSTTYFAFDELSRAKAIRDALGNQSYFFYDLASNRTSLVDPRANPTYYFYDTLNRRSATRDALGSATYYFYDAVGNRTRLWDALGNPSYFFYDGMSRNTVLRDAIGSLTYFFFDSESNVIAFRNPLLHPTYFGYDAINRRTIVQDTLGGVTYFQFDSVSNLVKVMDPNKNAVQTRYDSLDRPDALRMPDGGSSYFFYDGVSNRIKHVDPRGNATYYAYDSLNRLSAIQDALYRTLYFEYDAVSNLSRSMDAEGATRDASYDAVNRRTNLTYTAAGADVAASLKSTPYFVYDEASNLVQMGDLWGLHRLAYDALNRPVTHQFPNGSAVYFEFDRVSNLTGRVYPSSAGRAWAAYDTLNRQIRVQAPSGATAYFAYDAASYLTQRFLGNSAKQDIAYDAAERVSQWRNTNKSGVSLTYFDYTRDSKGRVTKAVREATHTVYYTYDVNDRLMSEIWAKTGATPSEVYGYRYAYDVAGNRTKLRANASNTYYFYDKGNQLTVSGSTSAYATPTYYIYDKNGSLTNMVEPAGRTYFAYNSAGLVARVRWKDASATYFFYDGNLQRYGMVEFGTAAYFLWDGPNLLQELKADGTVKEEHTNARMPIAGIGQLLETNRPGQSPQKVYPIMDPRGTITKQLQSDGTTVQAAKEYDAFGNLIPNSATGTWIGRVGYQGQAWIEIGPADASKRLLLSPTRIYDPATGRFIQIEMLPARRPQSHFLYADQNPMNLLDPLGLQSWDPNSYKQQAQRQQPEQLAPPPHGTTRIPKGSDRWNALQPAIEQAKKLVDAAIKALEEAMKNPCNAGIATSGPFSDLQKYFGTQDPEKIRQIYDNYLTIKNYLNSDLSNRLYDDPLKSESNRAYAVNEGTDNWGIAFQENFPASDLDSPDSGAGIILHEVSHAALRTMDRYKNETAYSDIEKTGRMPSAAEKQTLLERWANKPATRFRDTGAEFAIKDADPYKFFAASAFSSRPPTLHEWLFGRGR